MTAMPDERLDITLGSSYHNGICLVCTEPTRGVIVTVAMVGPLLVTLCWRHHNEFLEKMNKLGERMEI